MIGIAIIGYGYWGPNLARCFGETEGCRVVAIADSSADARKRAAKRFPAARMMESWRDVLSDPEVDAVAIATPVRTHYEIACAALESGRHVLVEKPMTETSDQARLLIEEACKRNLVLLVDHTFIYAPAIQAIHRLVESGDIGDLWYYDSTRINLGLFQRDVNVIWDLAVHDLSILQLLIGKPPLSVSATGISHITGTPENMAQITLHFDRAVAHLNVNWLAPVKMRRVLVGGSRKMIVYDELEPSEKVKVYDRGVRLSDEAEQIHQLLVGYRSGDMWAPHLPPAEPLLAETTHFIDCIANAATPITGGELGLAVVQTLEAATRSMRLRGHPVELTTLRLAS
jgi:predicted dehydrogenase